MTGQKKQKILIVDDDENNLELMSVILKNAGHECETAKDGREALYKTIHWSPDLIFLDIMLPDCSGYDVCRLLKADPHTGHIPVVLVTAMYDRNSRINGQAAGANGYLTKPFDLAEVQARAENILKINKGKRSRGHEHLRG